jgi:hypothetical protein
VPTTIAAVLLLMLLHPTVRVTDSPEPNLVTTDDFRRAMKEIIELKDTEPGKPYPQVRKLKLVASSGMFLCHVMEAKFFVASRQKQSDDARKVSQSAKTCVHEAESSILALFRTAQAEIQEKPAAVSKLKAYLATWLGVVRLIPRQAGSLRELAIVQQRDIQKLNAKERELDGELSSIPRSNYT